MKNLVWIIFLVFICALLLRPRPNRQPQQEEATVTSKVKDGNLERFRNKNREANEAAAKSDKQEESIDFESTVTRALTYLKETGQAEDGSFSSFAGPAVTALVTTSMMKNGLTLEDESVAKAMAYLENFVKVDGGVYAEESHYRNYETSLALLCFVTANENGGDGSYDKKIEDAKNYLKGIQWNANREIDESDSRWGGFGYGKHGRPDLSNTSFTIDVLITAGEDENSEAIQRALQFVSRSQNLESAHNTLPFASKNPDGGFIYTPSGDGESKAEATANGGLRSYGSMTYAGLRSMLYAGVDKEDVRVKAAADWLRMNYDLKTNPGMGAAGLYYYYHVFAKALDAFGEDTFLDSEKVAHDWRQELVAALSSRQNKDGSWTNSENDRWMEGDPNLVTGYALLALSYCKSK